MLVLSTPVHYVLELTPACNNRCPGCSNVYAETRRGDRSNQTWPKPLDAAGWQRIFDIIGPDAVQLKLSGGEPTLHPDFPVILEAATSYDAAVTLFTNGRWRRPHRIIALLRHRPGLAGLLISLHGARAESHEAFTRVPGSFDETVANIRLATDAGLTVAISTVITRHNRQEIEAIVHLARELGADHVTFSRYLGPPLPELEAEPHQLLAAVRRVDALKEAGEPVKFGTCVPQCFVRNSSTGCLAGVAYAAIDPWGRLRPCAHSPTIAGSLLEHPLAEIWHGPAMQAWRERIPSDCLNCVAFPTCHAGCRALPELRPDQRDPLVTCPLTEAPISKPQRRLPASGRPVAAFRLRRESFGYAVLGRGQVVPVSAAAQPLLDACDGQATFVELGEQYGPAGLILLGELVARGLVQVEMPYRIDPTPEGTGLRRF